MILLKKLIIINLLARGENWSIYVPFWILSVNLKPNQIIDIN